MHPCTLWLRSEILDPSKLCDFISARWRGDRFRCCDVVTHFKLQKVKPNQTQEDTTCQIFTETPSGECLQGKRMVWLIGPVVCSLAAAADPIVR